MVPQASLFWKTLSRTVSFRTPDSEIPVPTGPAAADPKVGTLGLLLSWTLLWKKTQHVAGWYTCLVSGSVSTGGFTPAGQEPSWGGGLSPFWLLVSKPSSLLSNCEFSTTRDPPEFDPE